MKKSRIFALLAAMAMGLAVFGCSNGDSDSSGGDTTGGSSSGSGTTGGTESGNTGGSTSGGGTESGATGGSTSGSIEPVAEKFVQIPGASIDGTEKWTPESGIFISRRAFKIGSFYMSDHELTLGEYKAVMGSDTSTVYAYDKDGNKLTGDDVKNNPCSIRWYDALVYCNTRSIKEGLTPCYAIGGKTNPSEWGEVPTSEDDTWDAAICDFTAVGYRLPTEIEWEWAARGGESYKYAGSDNVDEVAWYKGNVAGYPYGTREVMSKKANGYGLYDMSGNVAEWCWDNRFGIYPETPTAGPKIGSRCVRGGHYQSSDDCLSVAYRDGSDPDVKNGVRLVRSASDSAEDSPSCSFLTISEVFVQIPGVSIDGTENWTPKSEVFVSGQELEIASFYMSDHEVTREEYKAVMGSDPSTAKAYNCYKDLLTGDDAKNNPVTDVRWYDALVYCNTRSIKEGLTPCYSISGSTNPDDWGSVPESSGEDNDTWDAATCDFTVNGYRLPTLAEWEWAARGGEEITVLNNKPTQFVYNETVAVLSRKANAYGLYDMSGNVAEWCWDRGGIDRYYCKGFLDVFKNEFGGDSPRIPRNNIGFRLVRSSIN